jgi:ferredoxin
LWQAKALGFVGRGKNRHVDYPFGVRPAFCRMCGACITNCPMTIPPCGGPMKSGEERLCGQCESQLMVSPSLEGHCVWCELGKSFQCSRHD